MYLHTHTQLLDKSKIDSLVFELLVDFEQPVAWDEQQHSFFYNQIKFTTNKHDVYMCFFKNIMSYDMCISIYR